VGKAMAQDDFFKQQDIAYLDRKHKIGSWCLHKNLTIFIQIWAFNHLENVFNFQDVDEINGVHIPLTNGIQIPMQLQSMTLEEKHVFLIGLCD
jgi:hypothetical protein